MSSSAKPDTLMVRVEVMDNILISVDEEEFNTFMDILSGQVEDNPELEKTLNTLPPWESDIIN